MEGLHCRHHSPFTDIYAGQGPWPLMLPLLYCTLNCAFPPKESKREGESEGPTRSYLEGNTLGEGCQTLYLGHVNVSATKLSIGHV